MKIALDTETTLIGPGNVIPKLVCTSIAYRDDTILNQFLLSTVDESVYEAIEGSLRDNDCIFHNAGFDLGVFIRAYPQLAPLVFEALDEGRIHDTGIREKLLNLSSHGSLTTSPVQTQIKYSLADLVLKYLGINIFDVKEDEDSWRLNFDKLIGMGVDEYPKEAYEYAIEDAALTLQVFEAQEEEIQSEKNYKSLGTEYLHVNTMVCLNLMGAWGFRCDQKRKDKLAAQIEEDLSPENMKHLLDSGILRPAKPEMPYVNRARDKEGNLKMKAPVKESIDTKILKKRVTFVCEAHDIPIKMTPPSKTYPEGSVSADKEVLADLHGFDRVLDQYQDRATWQTILTKELPHMTGKVVHPCYDALKSTGRTSSYASKLYPSTNIQSKEPRIRPCFVARKGQLLYSVDYSALELCTFADTKYRLFGKSILKDIINEGIDPHVYLGSQLSYHLDKDFRKACGTSDIEAVLNYFAGLEKTNYSYFKEWRTFGKPVGLGFPGGLGPQTMVGFAKGYGVNMTIAEARTVRSIWLASFPEAVDYFEHISEECNDPNNEDKYCYTTPLGMYRAGCTYAAACNGLGMQSPAAEGFKLAVCTLARACYDPSVESILYGTHPVAAIHDEIVGEIPDDDLTQERVEAIEEIMQKSMAIVCPSVTIRTSACLMRRWYKEARPKHDDSGRLIPWRPKKKK